MKILGKSHGINWIHYYIFDFDGEICRLVDSYRLHKFDFSQGADKHPKGARPVMFTDFAHYSGYGHMNSHVTFQDTYEFYPMGELYKQADEWSTMRLKIHMGRLGEKSVAASVKANIERYHSDSYSGKFSHFGPMSKGCIY